ncbi:DUF2860 domain-containing protein [Vibrio splendidus]|uniref:DUF2860 domain-containing protein n=3 Tax=Vibrio TaxID=662 RepID=A0A2N7NJC3_9VIBR|nr:MULTISPECIES: DUF2860 family protein [Vibrio]PHN85387.1 DUF2860 domain-containing protein [Vibrio splendidus]EAQ53392.1 hypothetical protein MED222_19909 [Vibrio sp. MED222]MCB5357883.1 DUF2860 domain-containing protein [Vibrio lentus]MCB5448351.1 DUF2860 domain-containing protein [Vibrio lentus]MCB5460239.1 DUF2860 domain-containing protein [Vibrio lentus]
MKHIISLFLATMMLASPSYAALAPSEGFSGNMTFLTGFTANSSNLDVGQSNHQSQTDLMSSGATEANGMVAILGSMQYTFGALNHKQIFLGTSRDDIITGTLAFEVGYRQQLESGMVIDFSILPTLISGEVWDDPYAVDSKREETDLTGNVVRMQLSKMMGTNFNIDMAFGESDVKKENTGLKGLDLTDEERALMTREREYFYLKSGYQYFLKDGSGILTPSINVFSSNSEGNALSFLSVGAEVNLAKRFGNHGLAFTINAAKRDYDKENPIFNKTREDKDFGAFIAYEYANIFDAKNWSLVSLLGAKTTTSNIEYYQSSQYVVSVGVDYKF